MLQKLIIRNYAIIDNLTFEPGPQLNTVTGETGAGKSIVLGALSLILGERADTSVLINKEEKCVVEAWFDIKQNTFFKKALSEEELDEDDQCIIRREISSNGKSRAFVNDTPVVLTVLHKLTSRLVDLQQQFGHLALENDHFAVDIVDAVAGNDKLKQQYQGLYQSYGILSKQLAELKARQAAWQKEADYKQFLYEELEQAGFADQEIENAEATLKQLGHSEKIIAVLEAGKSLLEDGDQPLINELKRLGNQLQSIADVMQPVHPLQQRLSSAYAELKDVADELQTLRDKITLDPAVMLELQQRVDLGYKLCKKHAVQTTSELIALQQQLEAELQETVNLTENIAIHEKEQSERYKQLTDAAARLSARRQQVIPDIEKRINKLLQLVGMPNARFRVQIKQSSQPGTYGIDDITLMLDANKSGQFLPVHKAASGGEMSRIMLCIKSLIAKAMELPTLIFDEVDAGISGEAARQVGALLQELGRHHQLICITHQPQVAARGDRHFFVYKDADKNKRITTRMRVLQKDERVLAIAQMIGGETPSEAALQNARELVAV